MNSDGLILSRFLRPRRQFAEEKAIEAGCKIEMSGNLS